MTYLKANNPREATSSIVISFDAKWKNPILNNEFSVVFRKRGPKSPDLDWIYFYVSAPDSAIVGRAKVARYERVPLSRAVTLCKDAKLSEKELRTYGEGYDSLAVFSLSSIQAAKNTVCLVQLANDFQFKPPQSFIIMSQLGKAQLDKALGF